MLIPTTAPMKEIAYITRFNGDNPSISQSGGFQYVTGLCTHARSLYSHRVSRQVRHPASGGSRGGTARENRLVHPNRTLSGPFALDNESGVRDVVADTRVIPQRDSDISDVTERADVLAEDLDVVLFTSYMKEMLRLFHDIGEQRGGTGLPGGHHPSCTVINGSGT